MCAVLLPPGDNPIAINKYIISSPNHPLWVCGPSNFLFNGYRLFFSRGKVARACQGVKLTTHLHLVPRFKCLHEVQTASSFFFDLINHDELGQQGNENEKHKIWLEQLNG
jgi:hypothetical protein